MNDHLAAPFREALDTLKSYDRTPRVRSTKGCSETQFIIEGELLQVLAYVAEIFRMKDARGYGTHCHGIEMIEAGEYRARITHANSCD